MRPRAVQEFFEVVEHPSDWFHQQDFAPGILSFHNWGSLACLDQNGRKHRLRVFVMTMGWSRACYVELVRKADTAAFIQCHVNAFEYLGGVPWHYLYDNAKAVTLGRDEGKQLIWNRWMLDFALRVGFEVRLCQPYRAQTKGKVERGGQVRQGQCVAQHALHRPRRSQPPGTGVVRQRGQPEDSRDHPPRALGDADG